MAARLLMHCGIAVAIVAGAAACGGDATRARELPQGAAGQAGESGFSGDDSGGTLGGDSGSAAAAGNERGGEGGEDSGRAGRATSSGAAGGRSGDGAGGRSPVDGGAAGEDTHGGSAAGGSAGSGATGGGAAGGAGGTQQGGSSGSGGSGGAAPVLEQLSVCDRLPAYATLAMDVTTGYEARVIADCRVNWVTTLYFDYALGLDERHHFIQELLTWTRRVWGCPGHAAPEGFALIDHDAPLSVADASTLIEHYVEITDAVVTLTPGEIADLRAIAAAHAADLVALSGEQDFSRPNCGGSGGQGGAAGQGGTAGQGGSGETTGGTGALGPGGESGTGLGGEGGGNVGGNGGT